MWRSKLKNQLWSESCIEKFGHHIAESSIASYNVYINQFRDYCLATIARFPPEKEMMSACMAEFLSHKAEQSTRPESILKVVSAAFSHFCYYSNLDMPFSKDIANLVRGLIKHDTARPAARTKVMPTSKFTELFRSWGPNEGLSLKNLRLKAIALLALSCMTRPSDLSPKSGFLRDQISFHDDGSAIIRFFGVKNDSNRRGFEVRLDPAIDDRIDPVKCLKVYIEKTAHLTPNDKAPVFLTLNRPHSGLDTISVSQILREAIRLAGLSSEFTPRCFRPTGATHAVLQGLDPNFVRQRMRLKTESVFWERYVYPIQNREMTDKILSSTACAGLSE